MLNLYWKSDGQTRSLIERRFESEAELEKYIFDNQDILGGDLFLIHRQIRTGSKQGIPDMLGVDQDGSVCIVELKNQEAGEDILPQALGYAIWAETNPDSIRAIWLESKDRPEDIEMDWDNLDVRVILIAPSFKNTVPRMAGKIGYPIDLIRVRRYCFENEEFLLIEVVEEEALPRVTTTKVKGKWDWDYYESEHGKEATTQFRQAVEAIDTLVSRHGWDTPYNLNKYYTGFKLGQRIVFLVEWGGTRAWNVVFKLPEDIARAYESKQWQFQRYDKGFSQAVFKPLDPDSADIQELESLFVKAYQHISGTMSDSSK